MVLRCGQQFANSSVSDMFGICQEEGGRAEDAAAIPAEAEVDRPVPPPLAAAYAILPRVCSCENAQCSSRSASSCCGMLRAPGR